VPANRNISGLRVQTEKAPKAPKQPDFEQVLPLIESAGDDGLALNKIRNKIIGGAKAQDAGNLGELDERLGSLVGARAIHFLRTKGTKSETVYFAAGRGPSVEKVGAAIAEFALEPGTTLFSRAHLVKKIIGNDQLLLDDAISHVLKGHRLDSISTRKGKAETVFYFAPGRGPSIDKVSEAIARFALEAGTTLLSKADLAKAISEFDAPFFDAAIKRNVDSKVLAELTCGRAKAGAKDADLDKLKYYLHKHVAGLQFGGGSLQPPADLAFEDLLPVYRRIKAEQRGLSTVKILDLLNALQVPKDSLHRLLMKEAEAGRVSIHHSSVPVPPEVMEAGLRLEGFADPFVTVVVRRES
jgi:hypothetical protein